MAINRRYLLILIAAFFLATAPLWTQSSGSYVELRFVQRFSWTADEYAMRYEVIIEKEEAGRYSRFFQSLTEANFIEVSLSPGKFRCQVIPHDFFDQPITVTEWVEFEVRRGDDQLTRGELELIIVNPGDETSRKEIILAAPETAPETPTASEMKPSETSSEAEKITEYMRQFDIYLGAAYVPLFPIYSDNQLFGENVSPFGLSVRLCAVSAKESFLSLGMELATAWRIYGSGEQIVHSTSFDLNVLAQTRFPGGRAALNLRAGAGLSLLSNTQSTSSNGQFLIHLNIGASFLWLLTKNIYIEGGADYSQFFTEDHFGFLRPWIGVGYRF